MSARELGKFRLVARLHRSATAEVWQGVDPDGERHALKVSSAGRYAGMLRDEFAWLSMLTHPHIVQVHGLVEDAGTVGLALEYLAGGDLVSLAGAAPRCWLPAVADLAAALARLHERGIAHRDVKARNVMFDAEGRVRLIDFGSARRFGAARGAAGTTAAHRLAATGAVSADDDVHALAVLLHELRTGRLPDPAGPGLARASTNETGPARAATAATGSGLAALDMLVQKTLGAAQGAERPGLEVFADRIELAHRDETDA